MNTHPQLSDVSLRRAWQMQQSAASSAAAAAAARVSAWISASLARGPARSMSATTWGLGQPRVNLESNLGRYWVNQGLSRG